MALVDKKIAAVDEFNKALRFLVKSNQNLANDSKMNELVSKLTTALKVDESLAIEATGSYIDRFEYDIAAGNIDFLLEMDHNQALSSDVKGLQEDAKNEAEQIISFLSSIIKKNWENLGSDEKKSMVQRVKTMALAYSKYYLLTKQEKLKSKNVSLSVKSFPANTSRNEIIRVLNDEFDSLLPNDGKKYTFIFKMKSRDYLIERSADVIASDKALEIIHGFIKELVMTEIYKDVANGFNLYLLS